MEKGDGYDNYMNEVLIIKHDAWCSLSNFFPPSGSEFVYHPTSQVCKFLSFSTTALFTADNNECEREGKVVCQSGSSVSVCLLAVGE